MTNTKLRRTNHRGPSLGLALCTLSIALLAGCQQERNTNAPVTSVRDVAPATAAAATTAEPASVPKNDPSLPAATTSAAVSPPAPAAPSAPSAAGTAPTDAAQTALTPGERKNAQPLEGQTNSYSSDAFAKRGNDDVPRGTADSARGNESVSTPNVYPKVSK